MSLPIAPLSPLMMDVTIRPGTPIELPVAAGSCAQVDHGAGSGAAFDMTVQCVFNSVYSLLASLTPSSESGANGSLPMGISTGQEIAQ